jgi:hypothetical protein
VLTRDAPSLRRIDFPGRETHWPSQELLGERGVLEKRKKGKQMVFIAPADLSARLLKLEKEARVRALPNPSSKMPPSNGQGMNATRYQRRIKPKMTLQNAIYGAFITNHKAPYVAFYIDLSH